MVHLSLLSAKWSDISYFPSSHVRRTDCSDSLRPGLSPFLVQISWFPSYATDILQLITNHCAITCPLDPIPSAVLQSISGDLLPYLSSINRSLATGIVPPVFKCAHVTPLLKKPSLDPSSVKNYHLYHYFPSYPKLWNELYLTNSLFSNSTTIRHSTDCSPGCDWRPCHCKSLIPPPLSELNRQDRATLHPP